MKKTLSPLKASLLFAIASVLTAPAVLAQSTGSISVDRSIHYTQTDASTVTPVAEPYFFIFNVRSGALDTSNWGPTFYKPGTSQTPQTGPSSDTNTGTLNFSATHNNGADYMFIHNFYTDTAMASFYPIAPTDGGAYGVKFLGSAPPVDDGGHTAVFTAGLVFAAGTTYPSVVPQITNSDNDASWSGGKLHIKSSGTTTLSFNANATGTNQFTEYSSTSGYGAIIGAGIFDADGNVVHNASLEAYSLPVGDSTKDPDPIMQPRITQISLDGSWLIPGKTYTLELQYSIIAGRPEEANLNGDEYQGVSTYRRVVSISTVAGAGAATPSADFNADGESDLLWRHAGSGAVGAWLMNGTTHVGGYVSVATEDGGWQIFGNGDFNNDGQSDLLWRHAASGAVGVWLMNGTVKTAYVPIATEDGGWQIFGTGDFNHDGQSDLLWRHAASGAVGVWLMNGTVKTAYVPIATEDGGWQIIATGDFNHDGQSDLLWRHAASGAVGVWLMNGTTRIGGYVSVATEDGGWKIFGTGDFNHDGQSDLLWRHAGSGAVGVWLMNGTINTGYVAIATEDGGWQVINN